MKKISLLVLVLMVLALAFTACDAIGDLNDQLSELPVIGEPHVHQFAEEWTTDGTHHYHVCECGEKSDSGEHTWEGGSCTKDKVCSVCNMVESVAPGHTLVKLPAAEPTCETNGLTEGEGCSVCGVVTKAQEVVPALGHKGGQVTCTDKAICDVCNEPYGELLSHYKGTLVEAVEPTCETDGNVAYYHCLACGNNVDANDKIIADVVIPATGHDIVNHEALAPTCTEIGHNAYESCTACDYSTYEEIAATGHTPVEADELAPTCTEDGHTACTKCSSCGTILSDAEIIPALGHNHVAGEPVNPTCTEEGYTLYTCDKCGDSYKDDIKEVIDHTYSEYADKCDVCGTIKEGHKHIDADKSEACDTCGASLTPEEVVKAAYELEKGEKLGGKFTLTGVITEITDAYSTQYKNITLKIQIGDLEDYPIVCYRLKGTGADTLVVGQEITVTGELTNYGGTIEFNSGCTLDSFVHDHDYQVVVGEAATCLNDGLTDGEACALCGDVKVAQEIIPATGHNDGDGDNLCDSCGLDLSVEITGAELDFVTNFLEGYGKEWTSSYTKHEISFSDLGALVNGTVVLSNANKQTGTITDRPVICAKDSVQYVTITLSEEGKNISTVSFELMQWGTKTFADIHIEYYDATTETWVACSEVITTPGAITSNAALPAGVTSVRLSYVAASSKNTQIGLTGAALTFADAAAPCEHTNTTAIGELVPATHTTAGMTAGVMCADCDEVIEEQIEILPMGHMRAELVEAVPATHTVNGTAAHYYCAECDAKFESRDPAAEELTDEMLVVLAMGHIRAELVEAVPATHTTNGTAAYYYCAECDAKFESRDPAAEELTEEMLVVLAMGHIRAELVEAVPATHTTNGTAAYYYCAECDAKFESRDPAAEELTDEMLVVLAQGHMRAELVAAVPATHTTNGTAAYYYCAECDAKFESRDPAAEELTDEMLVLLATGHIRAELVEAKPATHTENGTAAYYYCAECDAKFEGRAPEAAQLTDEELVLLAEGHIRAELVDAVPASCTATGTIAYYYCAECDAKFEGRAPEAKQYTDEDIIAPALGHADVDTDYKCDVCGADLSADCPHENTTVAGTAVEATHKTQGLTAGTKCIDCGKVTEEQVATPALGHITAVYVDAKQATHTENGNWEHYFCEECGEYYDTTDADAEALPEEAFVINAQGHMRAELVSAIPATHTVNGTAAYYHCAECDANFESRDPAAEELTEEMLVLLATGHIRAELVAAIPATHTANGTAAYYYCADCDAKFESRDPAAEELTEEMLVVLAQGHIRAELVSAIPATHTTNGTAAYYYCADCDAKFEGRAPEAAELTEEDLVILAMGHTYAELVPAVPATHTTNGTAAYYYCATCDAKFEGRAPEAAELTEEDLAILAMGHTYAELVPAVPATCTEAGTIEHYYCAECDANFEGRAPEAKLLTNLTTPIADHNYGDLIEGTPASDTEDGVIDHYICSECSKTFNAAKEEVSDTVILSHKSIIDILYGLESGAQLDGSYTLTGIVVTINNAYSTQYGNVSVTIIVNGIDPSKTVQLFRLSGEGADLIGIGDTVTATGSLKNHYGTYELVDCTIDAYTIHTHTYETYSARCDQCGVVLDTHTQHTDADGDGACDACGEAMPTEGKTTIKYVFSEYTAGTQYAENEVHVLDETITMTTTQAHFTSELRLYSSSEHDGFAIIESTKDITSIVLNAGNKVDTLNVYTSTDGTTWTLASAVKVKSTSYADYTVDFATSTKYIKLDVAGTNQVRIKYMTITSVSSVSDGEETPDDCTHANAEAVGIIGPTCTDVGYEAGTYCPDCKTYTEGGAEIPATGHSEETIAAEDPTCTTAGKTEGKKCTVCNEILVPQQDVPATGHSGGTATCVDPAACESCGDPYGDLAAHNYGDDGVCTTEGCDATKPTDPEGGETEATPVTVVTTIADKGWENETKHTELQMDDVIKVTVSGGSNTGKYYTNGSNWRIYQNEKPSIVISAAEDKIIKTVKITYSVNNSGILTLDDTQIASGAVVDVNANSITFSVGNTGTETNGQVRITAIEVTYA